jgi:hypothetical protein
MYVSMGVRIDDFVKQKVTQTPSVKITKFRGYPEAAVANLMYLIQRNKHECVALANFDKFVKRIKQGKPLTWTDVGFVWKKSKIRFPGGSKESYTKSIHKCTQKVENRFILNILTIVTDKFMHANIILFDQIAKTVERFDPYEENVTKDMTEFDNQLELFFNENVTKLNKYYRPEHTGVRGIQLQQEEEKNTKHIMDPVGFCNPWTILYAETRLTYPEQDPRVITNLYKSQTKLAKITLTAFIRNYADYLDTIAKNTFRHVHMSGNNPHLDVLASLFQQLQIYQTIF